MCSPLRGSTCKQLDHLFVNLGVPKANFYICSEGRAPQQAALVVVVGEDLENGRRSAVLSFRFIAEVIASVMQYVRHVELIRGLLHGVRHLVFEFAYWLLPDFANAPGPCGDRGEMAMAIARLFCHSLFSVRQTLLSFPCIVSRSLELPATTVGEWRRRHSL